MVDQSRPTSIPGVETFHRREVWQDPNMPVVGPAPTLDQWDTFPLHYTAADDLIDGDPGEHADNLPAYLRAIQRDYTVNRGYSIGYGFAVDWLGGVWELRGYDIKNAANRGWNHRTGPVLCLVDGADPLTAEALWSVRALFREANRRTGRSLNLAGHRDIGATACPGDGIYRQITSGQVTPLTDAELTPTQSPEENEVRYMLKPPADRAGGPWFLRWDGTWSYLTGRDRDIATADGLKVYDDLVSRYDLVHAEVFGTTPE